jgi:hypothetical protein
MSDKKKLLPYFLITHHCVLVSHLTGEAFGLLACLFD